jgi:hypothetical protein
VSEPKLTLVRITPSDFEARLKRTDDDWQIRYQTAQICQTTPQQTANANPQMMTPERWSPLLVQWLLSAQGLNAPENARIAQLTTELSFPSQSAYRQLSFR